MKYSLKLLDESINKWIVKAYNKSPNKKFLLEYLRKEYSPNNDVFFKALNSGVVKFQKEIYTLYSLGKNEEVEDIFLRGDKICALLSHEEIYELINKGAIIDTNSNIKKNKNAFPYPPNYKIVDDSLRTQLFKHCKGFIISKEIERKLNKEELDEIITNSINRNQRKNNAQILEQSLYNESLNKKTDTGLAAITTATNAQQKPKGKDDEPPKEINVFCERMPLSFPRNHFNLFVKNKSKLDKKPFLTKEELDLFIDRAFCGNTDIEMLTFHQSPKGEKLIIQRVFYDFYLECKKANYFDSTIYQNIFIKLLTDNFKGFHFDKLNKNFNPKTKNKLT